MSTTYTYAQTFTRPNGNPATVIVRQDVPFEPDDTVAITADALATIDECAAAEVEITDVDLDVA